MAKKIFFSICGALVGIGFVIALVGFVMGGRPGHFYASDGRLYYDTIDGRSIDAGRAPHFMNDWTILSLDGGYGYWGWGWGYGSDANKGAATANGKIDLPFTAAELSSLDLNIEAGYLTIEYGDEPGLYVEGDMPYRSTFVGGEWKLHTDSPGSLTTRQVDGRTHYFHNGTDVTTDFVLTLPRQLENLTVQLDVVNARIEGLELSYLNLYAAVGNITIDNLKVDNAILDVDVAKVNITNTQAGYFDISCAVGSVTYEGDISDTLNVDCEVGTVKVSIPRPASYGYMVTSALGRVRIDGQTMTSMFDDTATHLPDARPLFIAECEVGSVDISFT